MGQFGLRVEGQTFRDVNDREIILRGINVAGDAKYPKTPDMSSQGYEGFFDPKVSFVGRPFPLEDADLHFERLRNWGYNTIRYIFTWEAIEHAGPGIYDQEWVDFTIEIIRVAKRFGFYVFMDPHQDVWSRLSGGSGAPTWTLYAAGLNPRSFKNTQAALVQNTWENPAEFPKMLWCTNYTRLACQTMFTLFWAGQDFAPKAIIDGVNIQQYLQDHFIAAIKYLAQQIHDAGGLENEVVIGWESINEPHKGLIGVQDISAIPPEQHLQLGTSPTAFQSMLMGSGRPCTVKSWAFGKFGPYKKGKESIDPKGESAWLPVDYDDTQYGWHRDTGWRLGECIWAQHGVWHPNENEGTLLRKDYFSKNPRTGEKLNYDEFTNTYFMAHYRAYKKAIRSVCIDTIMFCQPPVMEVPPSLKGTLDDDPNMVHAVHFYDGLTLLTKHWNRLYNLDIVGLLRGKYLAPVCALKIGETSIRKSLCSQLKYLREESLRNMGDHPLIFTEIGIPYDMDDKYAYKTGDYRSQIKAMDANHVALEGSNANGFTLWVYMTENNHDGGDQWNGEDLSIYSKDDLQLPIESAAHSTSITDKTYHQSSNKLLRQRMGHRAEEAHVRPSPVCVNGRLNKFAFDLKNCVFAMTLTALKNTPHTPTEIYLPELHFPEGGIEVMVSGGEWDIKKEEFASAKLQYLRWWHAEGEVGIKIRRCREEKKE